MELGLGVGTLLSPSGAALLSEAPGALLACWLALPGHIFLALIQMVIVPLVMASVVLGVVSTGEPSELRTMGFRIGPYFVGTTFVAVLIGGMLAVAIEPGSYVDGGLVERASGESAIHVEVEAAEADPRPLPERIAALIPTNPLGAALNKSMLQLVVLALLIGVAMVSLPKNQARPLVELAGATQQVTMQVVSWAMRIAPLAVFGLLAQITTRIGLDAILAVSVYVGTVLLGLLLLLGFYLGIVTVVGRRSPWEFLQRIREVQLLAFSTSSSAAVMPLSMETARKELGVRRSVTEFIVQLGATVNMDGTALYQVIAAVFLTQVFGVELTLGSFLLLTATTVGASIGAPSSPGVGIVILATVLEGLGVPASGIAVIIGVDRILDMSRTAVNVTGDLTACIVMQEWLPESSEGEP